jgi:hypothetical protein
MDKFTIANLYASRGHKITKVLSWSLTSIPETSITSDTIALLPQSDSEAFIVRATSCGYDPANITSSYNRVEISNLKLFDEKITESLVFYDDDTCMVSTYLENESGNSAPTIIINEGTELYEEKLRFFNQLWDKY